MNGDSHVRKTLARLVGIGQDQALASTKNPSAREASSQCGLRLAMDRARRLHYLSRVFRMLGAGRHSWLRIEVNEFPICTQQRPAYSDIVERFHGSVPFRSGLSTDGPAIRTGLHQILE